MMYILVGVCAIVVGSIACYLNIRGVCAIAVGLIACYLNIRNDFTYEAFDNIRNDTMEHHSRLFDEINDLRRVIQLELDNQPNFYISKDLNADSIIIDTKEPE